MPKLSRKQLEQLAFYSGFNQACIEMAKFGKSNIKVSLLGKPTIDPLKLLDYMSTFTDEHYLEAKKSGLIKEDKNA